MSTFGEFMAFSGKTRRLTLSAAISSAALASACVVTTFEGAGEPPRVLPPPDAPKSTESEGQIGEAPGSDAVEPGPNEPREISARHILVSYRGARSAARAITRPKEEALARAQEAERRARAGEDFAALVKEYSDEPGAGERGGELGRFQRGMMVTAFENAAFKLEAGQISSVVETEFGFHVIQRTE